MASNKRQKTTGRPVVRNDRLGKLIMLAATRFAAAASWESFVTTIRGPSNLQDEIAARTGHPAGEYLDRLRPIGAPVLQKTRPWNREAISIALARGSHKSALSHLEFLRDEMADMIEQGYWVILPYSNVLHLPHLRLSPLGVVPQRDRRPRIIVDYTFWGINDDTVPLAPSESMQFGRALERVLHKIRRANRRFGPTYMIKVDIADGFYRLFVSAPTTATLGVVFPQHDDEEPLIAFPLVLPMGWVGSPPFFCALTETATDLANKRLRDRSWSPATHRLSSIADAATNFKPVTRRPPPRWFPTASTEAGSAAALHPGLPNRLSNRTNRSATSTEAGSATLLLHPGLPTRDTTDCSASWAEAGSAATVLHPGLPTNRDIANCAAALTEAGSATTVLHPGLPFRRPNTSLQPCNSFALKPFKHPLSYVDIYMDDFLGLAQGHPGLRERVRSTIFHSIDDILRPNAPTDSVHRNEPISLSKLAKGDAKWATRKVLLGWIVDTVAETVELPEHRRLRFLEILETLQDRRRVSLQDWHKALGELRSMILAIPGGRGFFSTLQTGFKHADKHRIRINKPMHDAITDLHHLALDIGSRPTRFGEIVPDLPIAIGTADASGAGMGGIWLSHDPAFQPLVWRSRFPSEVQDDLVSTDNPHGRISNSDLELAGQIAHLDVLNQHSDCRERTVSTLTDNISARSWQRKGSTTTLGPAAYLLRLQALHQRHHRYLNQPDYIPGPANAMADDASRLWHLTDTAFLHHLNFTYPQNKPWKLCTLRPAMLSALIMALQCKRSEPALFLHAPDPKTTPGFDGATIVKSWESTPCSTMWTTRSRSSKSLPNAGEQEKSHPAVNLSALAQWRMPYAPSVRRWPAWGPKTSAATPAATSNTDFNNNSKATNEATHRPHASNRSRLPLSITST